MLVSISRHRRRILLTALGLAAAGYASCWLYRSPVLTRRRKQILVLLRALSFLSIAVSESAESLSIISTDLRTFLASDNDQLPPSLRQAFKIGQCPEFRQSLVVFFAALTEGALQGKTRAGQKLEKSDRTLPHRSESLVNDQMPSTVEASDQQETPLLGRLGLAQCPKSEQRTFAVEQVGGTSRSDMKLSLPGAELVLDKLFSDSGTGFASVVVGSVARNLVLALLGGPQGAKKDAHGQGSSVYKIGAMGMPWDASSGESSEELSEVPAQVAAEVTLAGGGMIRTHSAVLDFLCSEKCRHLIAECIQNFVSSAVSVYIDKTKDINYYDDMVAGITNPRHNAQMKELLVSVCNGAVETFIRTSHEVFFSKSSVEAEVSLPQQKNKMENVKKEPFGVSDDMPFGLSGENESMVQNDQQGALPLSHISKAGASGSTLVGNVSLKSLDNACRSSAEGLSSMFIDEKRHVHSWIDGVSRTLAIPSNRMLVMDIAGKMSSEAVRSVFEVMTSTISNVFKGRDAGIQGWLAVRSSNIAKVVNGQAKAICKLIVGDLNGKLVVLATIFLALCLHLLIGSPLIESS